MLRRAIASGFLVVLVACAAEEKISTIPEIGPDCVPVGSSLKTLIGDNLLSGSIEGEMYATPSRINEGVWLISARINGDVAVFSTDGDPQAADFSGLIVAVNEGALAHSDAGVDIPDDAPAPVAKERTEDPGGVDAAEGCVG